MIAITGATGQLGRLVIEKLKARHPSSDIVALVRDPAKAEEIGLGVEARAFDYNDPDVILAGLEGIDTLLLISGSDVGVREIQHRNVIFGAMEQAVSRIVYTSLLHAPTSPLALATEHVATEMILRDSNIPFSILRNGWYTENYAASALQALEAGALYGAAGDGKISAAARVDYAEAAVAVLVADDPQEIYELSGDMAFTLSDLAVEISRQSGKDIPYVNMEEDAYAAALAEAGLPAPWPAALARIDVQVTDGALYDEGTTLSELIGRPTTPLSDVVAAALAQGQ